MSLEWRARSSSLAWSNPLAWWWGVLTLVSGVNIAVWFLLYRQLHEQPTGSLGSTSGIDFMLLQTGSPGSKSGIELRARMFSGSACSTPGCRASSSAGR